MRLDPGNEVAAAREYVGEGEAGVPNAGTALPVCDPAGGSLDLKPDRSLLGLVNTVVK